MSNLELMKKVSKADQAKLPGAAPYLLKALRQHQSRSRVSTKPGPGNSSRFSVATTAVEEADCSDDDTSTLHSV